MGKWYKRIEHGTLGVQVVTTYLTDVDFYYELDAKYSKLMAALYGRRSILDFVKMEVLVSTLNDVLSKIGPFYDIPQIPQNRTSLRTEEELIVLSVFFFLHQR